MTRAHDEAMKAVRSLAPQDELREESGRPVAELLPCPFCGHSHIKLSREVTEFLDAFDKVECCWCQASIEAAENSGVTVWNDRKPDLQAERDRLKQDVAELVEELGTINEWIKTGEVDGVHYDEMSICGSIDDLLAKHKPAEDARRGA